jgi:hypothetical protein
VHSGHGQCRWKTFFAKTDGWVLRGLFVEWHSACFVNMQKRRELGAESQEFGVNLKLFALRALLSVGRSRSYVIN